MGYPFGVISRRRAVLALGALALSSAGGCEKAPRERPSGRVRVVFKHQPLGGDPGPLRRLLTSFEQAHPEIEVVAELLPAAPGAVHQYYVTALEGRAQDFDVLVIDVIWVAELARAGWIADLSGAFPADRIRKDFLAGPVEAVLVEGGTYGVPWYADVGVLYRRIDIVPEAPSTYQDILSFRAPRGVHGYLWQGLQSESLVCNAYEAIWGHGGQSTRGGRLLLDTPEAREGLGYLRSLLTSRISPPSVTSMAEEESRRVFQAGSAALMRNWPYAWSDAESPGSPVRGRVGVSPLPSVTGEPGAGALGGFQLALNVHTPSWKVPAAEQLIDHLTSPEANLMLALAYGRLPARRASYDHPALVEGAPMIAALLPAAERAKPRPVTPYYPMFSDTLAAEMSAAINGVRSVAASLGRAQRLLDHLVDQSR